MNGENREDLGDRIAKRGREALVERLRPAFSEAASSHADVLAITPEELEAMVQRSADRADGLQWRRALAAVAMEELGIDLREAIAHPAVARAQELLGVPSYEESLAAMTGRGWEPPLVTPRPAEERSLVTPLPSAEPPPLTPPPAEESPHGSAPVEASAPVEVSPPAEAPAPAEPSEPAEASAATEAPDTEPLRLSAVHVQGIATLQAGEQGLELLLGEPGLDIARQDGRVLGRLRWQEIRALEVPTRRSLRRRRKAGQTQLVVRTAHGQASFEVSAMGGEELRTRLSPLLARWAGR